MKKGKFKEVVVFSSNFHYGNGNFPKAGKAEMCSYFFALFLLLLPPTRKKAIQKSSLYREGIRNSFSLGVPELKKKWQSLKKPKWNIFHFVPKHWWPSATDNCSTFLTVFFFQVICPTYSVVTLRDHVWAKFQRTVYLLLPVKKYEKGCHKGQRRNDEGYYSVNCD